MKKFAHRIPVFGPDDRLAPQRWIHGALAAAWLAEGRVRRLCQGRVVRQLVFVQSFRPPAERPPRLWHAPKKNRITAASSGDTNWARGMEKRVVFPLNIPDAVIQ